VGLRSIGLTGGIGSGKSTVAALLVAHGAHLVDTDAIAREISAPGGLAIPALTAAFGPEVLGADGALDRERMRALAFGEATAKSRLEAVLHPLIGAEAARRAALGAGRTVLFDVPLLAEGGARWRQRVQRVLVVDCDEATQVARVVARSGWSARAAQAVIDRQAPRAQRRAIADAVIFNEAITREQLADEVHALAALWQLGSP